MPDYKSMYFTLFNAVTTAIHALQDAQQNGEAAYMDEAEILRFMGKSTDEDQSTNEESCLSP